MRVLRRSFTPNKEILKFTCQRRKCEYDLRGSGCDVTFVLLSQRKGTRVNVSGHARRRTLHHRLRALGFCSTTRRTDLRLCKFTRKRNPSNNREKKRDCLQFPPLFHSTCRDQVTPWNLINNLFIKMFILQQLTCCKISRKQSSFAISPRDN